MRVKANHDLNHASILQFIDACEYAGASTYPWLWQTAARASPEAFLLEPILQPSSAGHPFLYLIRQVPF
jgi:hypothetical protein